MFASDRRDDGGFNIWPGFVDVLATILLVFVFVLLFFVLAQFYLSDALFGRDQALAALEREVAALEETLAMERGERDELAARADVLSTQLRATLVERDTLQTEMQLGEAERRELARRLGVAEEEIVVLSDELRQRLAAVEALQQEVEDTEQALAREQRLTTEAEMRIEALRRDVQALREQLVVVAEALGISDAAQVAAQGGVDELGRRLNVALAERVRELDRYRSEFFGRLREVLAEVEEIEIVGDRFRFQSEVFFPSASAEVAGDGQSTLRQVAATLQEVIERIPEDIDWVLQVEGHTDQRPISTERFPSNWELSTARATSIVHFLIDAGIPAERLAAAGFGEYHPLDPRDEPEAWARNRRIELRLTNR